MYYKVDENIIFIMRKMYNVSCLCVYYILSVEYVKTSLLCSLKIISYATGGLGYTPPYSGVFAVFFRLSNVYIPKLTVYLPVQLPFILVSLLSSNYFSYKGTSGRTLPYLICYQEPRSCQVSKLHILIQ